MIRLLRSHPIALTGFMLATVITVFFLFRLAVQTIYWSDPAHQHLAPQPWMTVGYVARSWGIAPEDLVDAAGLPPPRHLHGHPLSLAEIAAGRGIPVDTLVSTLQAAIDKLRAGGGSR